MYCQMCGAGMPEDAAFCAQCGARVPIAPGAQQPSGAPSGEGAPSAPPQSGYGAGPQAGYGAGPQAGYGQPASGGGQWGAGYYDASQQAAPKYFYAGFWPRVGANLLDAIFALLLAIIPAAILAISLAAIVSSSQGPATTFAEEEQQDEDVVVAAVVGAVIGYAPVAFGYLWVANAKGGGWGKRIVGIKIVRERDGQAPGWGSGFVRTIMPSVFGMAGIIPLAGSVVPLLNYLWCIWDEKKQTWHDKVAGTIVIEK